MEKVICTHCDGTGCTTCKGTGEVYPDVQDLQENEWEREFEVNREDK